MHQTNYYQQTHSDVHSISQSPILFEMTTTLNLRWGYRSIFCLRIEWCVGETVSLGHRVRFATIETTDLCKDKWLWSADNNNLIKLWANNLVWVFYFKTIWNAAWCGSIPIPARFIYNGDVMKQSTGSAGSCRNRMKK